MVNLSHNVFCIASQMTFLVRIAQSHPNVYKHCKSHSMECESMFENQCYSLQTTYIIFEAFQILFPAALFIFTAAKLFHQDVSDIRKNEALRFDCFARRDVFAHLNLFI